MASKEISVTAIVNDDTNVVTTICRGVQTLTGIVLILAAILKLAPGHQTQKLLVYVPFMTNYYSVGVWGYMAICDWEFILGTALLCFPSSKLVIRAAMATQVVFIVTLLGMLIAGQKSCGCLSQRFVVNPVWPLLMDLVSFCCLFRLSQRPIGLDARTERSSTNEAM